VKYSIIAKLTLIISKDLDDHIKCSDMALK
jgi:hypothetical protein